MVCEVLYLAARKFPRTPRNNPHKHDACGLHSTVPPARVPSSACWSSPWAGWSTVPWGAHASVPPHAVCLVMHALLRPAGTPTAGGSSVPPRHALLCPACSEWAWVYSPPAKRKNWVASLCSMLVALSSAHTQRLPGFAGKVDLLLFSRLCCVLVEREDGRPACPSCPAGNISI